MPSDEVGGRAVVGGDAHRLLAGETAVAAHEIDSGTLQPLDLAGVVPVAGHGVAATEHGRDVEVAGDGLLRAVDVARGLQGGTAAQQSLRRHARPVRALAPDQLGLDDDGRESGLHGTVGNVLAHGAGTDDDEVVFAFAHVPHASEGRRHCAGVARWHAGGCGAARVWGAGCRLGCEISRPERKNAPHTGEATRPPLARRRAPRSRGDAPHPGQTRYPG